MKIFKSILDDPFVKSEAAVVIDVCRAFTTAAYVFFAGAQEIILVRTIQEAFQLKQENMDFLLLGEENGLPIDGFDYWNSPSEISTRNLSGKTIIQRTTAGTQGMVAFRDIPMLLAGTFVNAGATIQYLRDNRPESINFVMTGVHSATTGLEDEACADYFINSLNGNTVDSSGYLSRVRSWNPEKICSQPDLLRKLYEDLECCSKLDDFDFVMKASKLDQLLILKPVQNNY
jgi:2-phosphosulfolactate phosphatase